MSRRCDSAIALKTSELVAARGTERGSYSYYGICQAALINHDGTKETKGTKPLSETFVAFAFLRTVVVADKLSGQTREIYARQSVRVTGWCSLIFRQMRR